MEEMSTAASLARCFEILMRFFVQSILGYRINPLFLSLRWELLSKWRIRMESTRRLQSISWLMLVYILLVSQWTALYSNSLYRKCVQNWYSQMTVKVLWFIFTKYGLPSTADFSEGINISQWNIVLGALLLQTLLICVSFVRKKSWCI